MDPIASALEGARKYVSGHPEEARYTDSEARAIADSSLPIRVMGPNGEEVTTDFPASVGEATASCVAALVVMRAASQGLGSIRVEVTVDSVSEDRGILGLDDAVAAPRSADSTKSAPARTPEPGALACRRHSAHHAQVQFTAQRKEGRAMEMLLISSRSRPCGRTA
jgi:hypothetical protein